MTTKVTWVNLTAGDVARALMLYFHCYRHDAAGAGEIIREAREAHRTEALSLAMAYVVVGDMTDAKAAEMQQAAIDFRAAELHPEHFDDGNTDEH
jgi:hypothetical protein